MKGYERQDKRRTALIMVVQYVLVPTQTVTKRNHTERLPSLMLLNHLFLMCPCHSEIVLGKEKCYFIKQYDERFIHLLLARCTWQVKLTPATDHVESES